MTNHNNTSKKISFKKLNFPLLKKTKENDKGKAPKNPRPGSAGGGPIASF